MINPAFNTNNGTHSSSTSFGSVDAIENTTSFNEEEEKEEEQIDGNDQTIEVVKSDAASSSCCTCNGCTLSPYTNDTLLSLCQLYEDGCHKCYNLYYYDSDCSTSSKKVASNVPTAMLSQRQCLFRCCIQESRSVKDLYVQDLERILSLSFSKYYTNNNTMFLNSRKMLHPNDKIEPQIILPNGTDVLCSWYWNGVRVQLSI
jgi:hypothetical protein